MLINKTKKKNIKKIIEKYYNAILFKVAGSDQLSAEEKNILMNDKIIFSYEKDIVPAVEEAYIIGNVRSPRLGEFSKHDLKHFRKFGLKKYKPLSRKEQYAIEHVKDSMGIYITKLKEDFSSSVMGSVSASNLVHSQEAALESFRSVAVSSIKKKKGISRLASDLRDLTGKSLRDWDRVASTEMSSAFNQGAADSILERNDGDSETMVYKIVSKDAALCSSCRRLYSTPSGEPRLYTMTEMMSNGTNYGRKASEYKATIGPMHPYCRCSLVELPVGFGFKPGTQRLTFIGTDINLLKEQRKKNNKKTNKK